MVFISPKAAGVSKEPPRYSSPTVCGRRRGFLDCERLVDRLFGLGWIGPPLPNLDTTTDTWMPQEVRING